MKYLFLLISIINILYQDRKDMIGIYIRRCSKTLLMPVLLMIYIMNANQVELYILLALIFSWFGDIILMGRLKRKPLMIIESNRSFLMGLSCFLVGHVFYVLYFMKKITLDIHHPFNTGLLTILILFGVLVLKGVKPKGILLVGTLVYTCVIGGMMAYALNIFMFQMSLAHFSIAVGAILFGSSDTVLAFRDIKKIKLPNTYVMFSYIVGQYMIILGIL